MPLTTAVVPVSSAVMPLPPPTLATTGTSDSCETAAVIEPSRSPLNLPATAGSVRARISRGFFHRGSSARSSAESLLDTESAVAVQPSAVTRTVSQLSARLRELAGEQEQEHASATAVVREAHDHATAATSSPDMSPLPTRPLTIAYRHERLANDVDSTPPLSHVPDTSSTITSAFLNSLNFAAALVRRADHTIVHFNEAASELFGYMNVEARDHSLQWLFPRWNVVRRSIDGGLASGTSSPAVSPGGRTSSLANGALSSMSIAGLTAASSALTLNSSSGVAAVVGSKQHDGHIFGGMSWSATHAPRRPRRTVQGCRKDGSVVWAELTLSEVTHDLGQSLLSLSSPSFSVGLSSSLAIGDGGDTGSGYLLATIRELTPLELVARQSRYEAEFDGKRLS